MKVLQMTDTNGFITSNYCTIQKARGCYEMLDSDNVKQISHAYTVKLLMNYTRDWSIIFCWLSKIPRI